MSAQEIISELPKLTPDELRQVKAKVEELVPPAPPGSLWNLLSKWAGKAEGLPADLAENHDHYLHGAPKRKP
jgi:hypothetical protein